jgi:peroxiredoxin-like protein
MQTQTTAHVYRVRGSWQGGLHGRGYIENGKGKFRTEFGVSEDLGGLGGDTNPEEMFLASACSCYLVTLAIIVEKMQLPVKKLECTAEGRVSPDQEGGYHLTEIILNPHFEMDDHKAHAQAITRAVKLAEQRCIISRAVKGSVKYQIQHAVRS